MGVNKRIALLGIVCLVAAAEYATAQQGPDTRKSEPVARPRTKGQPSEAELPPIPSKYGKKEQPPLPEGLPTFRTDVTTVTVDVAVVDNRGNFIPNIPGGNFLILEDKVPQKITGFSMGEAPMTVCMVIEWSGLWQSYWSETWYQTLTAAYGFLETLKPEDYVAVVAYDLRPEILSDFSTDKRQAYEAMQRLRIAAYSESNLYDAIVDTAERMADIEGRKAIVLISSGVDTFSKLNFGETRRRLQMAGVPIYAIGLMQALREWMDARGYLGSIARLDFLQADNQMRTFAQETGGMAFFPRFYGEFPGIFNAIAQALRNQYSLTYQPTNQAKDGKFRKIEVALVNPQNGEKLKIVDQKGKPIKYRIIAKAGYTAPREVE
jgi:VWFA-related protein